MGCCWEDPCGGTVCYWHLYSVICALCAQLFYLDAAAEILEWPLTMLRKATIPLLERECYSRLWFLTALVSPTPAPCQRVWVTSIRVLVCVKKVFTDMLNFFSLFNMFPGTAPCV